MVGVDNAQADAEVLEKEETVEKIIEPRNYKVLLHNDDITTQAFVVEILCRIFNKNREEATTIMLRVHNDGIGLCGVYTKEIAETKVGMVTRDAARANFPLRCTMEEA